MVERLKNRRSASHLTYRKPNICLIVLDTLREDHANSLDGLASLGFRKFCNAISPGPWTLPSHVSMMTGDLPSAHGIHASLDAPEEALMSLSRARLGKGSIVSWLKEFGYRTYGLSANPFITPQFGFDFDEFELVEFDDAIPGPRLLGGWETNHSAIPHPLQTARELVRTRRLRRLAYETGAFAFSRPISMMARRGIGRKTVEKGSGRVLQEIRRKRFQTPFFLFVNLMEAHEPYLAGEAEDVTRYLSGMPEDRWWWAEGYRRGAALAVARCVEVLNEVMASDPLIIVTSDHGQLIGEGGRYGHGFYLDDQLVRVPLYVRFPTGLDQCEVGGPVVSLTEVAGIIENVVASRPFSVGSDTALSESFGYYANPLSLAKKHVDLRRIFARRIRISKERGYAIFNFASRQIEVLSGDMTDSEISRELTAVEGAEEMNRAEIGKPRIPEEDAIILERLRALGYE